MADLRRQLHNERASHDETRRKLEAVHAIIGEIDPEYAAAYRDMCDLATHGIRRPDDLGGPVTTNGASSRPPNYNHTAATLVAAEKREQRRRARDLVARFRQLVDGAWAQEAPEYRRADA